MLVKKQRFDTVIEILFLVSAFLLVIGTPLVFTSLTRSVFEVNKLLLLRVLTLFTFGIWFFKYLAYQNNPSTSDNDATPTIRTRFFTWKKMGLEIPLILWTIVNILSTVFSQNIRVSIIGAYDRWEGIITIVNYVLLIFMISKTLTKRYQLNWVIGGIIGSTALSAIYGILQSLGFDFMNWSQDPTFRVFACINNPVHYCAYVAMVVPLCFGTLLAISQRSPDISLPQEKRFTVVHFFALAVSLVMLKLYAFPSSYDWGAFGLFSVIVTGTWFLCIYSQRLVPTKREAATWALFGIIVFAGILFNFFDFTREQWFGYSLSFIGFYVLTGQSKSVILKRLIFSLMILTLYAQVLSFSRATWVGFLISMPFFYLIATKRFASQSSKTFMGDVIATSIGLFAFTLIQTFKIFSTSVPAGFLLSSISAICFLYSFVLIRNDESAQFQIKPLLQTLISIALLITLSCDLLSFSTSYFSTSVTHFMPYLFLIVFIWSSALLKGPYARFVERFVLIVLFAHVQITGKSLFDIIFHLSLAFSYYLISLRGLTTLKRESKFWLLLFALLSGISILIPSLSNLLKQFEEFVFLNAFYVTAAATFGLLLYGLLLIFLVWGRPLLKKKSFQLSYAFFSFAFVSIILIFHLNVNRAKSEKIMDQQALGVANNIQSRSQKYEGQFEQSARMSMWKSAIPWFKDYFLLGTGPDTVKFMYPVYRRPEYGILEGGHNFTPDRLHNEYINTLVTRGSLGFIAYYGGIVLTWLGIILFWLYRNPNNPYRFIATGASIGACIYLGQVLFNFGVVATLVLFYVLMGISLAIRLHPEFQNDENEA